MLRYFSISLVSILISLYLFEVYLSFKEKILHPVTNVEYLQEQYDIMEYFITNWDTYSYLRKTLSKIKDIEYLYRKIIFGH